MESQTALIVAVASAALAVGIVAADLELGLEVELQTAEGGDWVTVAKEGLRPERFGGFSCPGQDLRIVVDNDRLIAATEHIHISYFDASAQKTEVILDESWELARNEERSYEFRIPDNAFNTTGNGDGYFPPVYLEVRVADQYLGSCVEVDA